MNSSTPGLSPGSVGGAASPGMQDRYQRLATEYSKARQQVIVLKAGVLEEQKRSGQLTEELNSARQALRKREEEADSLGFLNRQLQARVDQLVESLEGARRPQSAAAAAAGRGGVSGASSFGDGNPAVLEEELQRKIAENARLHQELMASQEAARCEAARHQELLATAEDAASAAAAARDSASAAAVEEKRSAAAERARLEARAAAAEKAAEAAAAAAEASRAESAGLRRDTELLSGLLRNSEEAQVARRWSQWVQSLAPTLLRALKALVDLQLHTEQRLRAAGSWTEPASARLRACVACLRAVCAELPADAPHLATDAHLLAALRRCGQLAGCLADLASPLAAAVASEHLSPELQALNAELCAHLAGGLADAVRSLGQLGESSSHSGLLAASSRSQLADLAGRRFDALAEACQRLGCLCSRKSDLEAALRVADDIAAGNRAVHAAACTLVAKTQHLAGQVRENGELILSRLMFATVSLSSSPTTAAAADTAASSSSASAASAASANVAAPTQQPPPSSSSASSSLQLQPQSPEAAAAAAAETAILREDLERRVGQVEQLESRLAALQTRFGQLEKERERWMLEAQVMSARLGKRQASPSPSSPSTGSASNSNSNISGLADGGGGGGGGGGTSAEVAHLKAAFLEAKCADAETAIQSLESRLMHAQLSAKAASQRLVLALDEVARLKDAAFRGREELDTTSKNYEEQLAAISDHVTDLNRQLERREAELNGLRAQFSSTVAKKKR